MKERQTGSLMLLFLYALLIGALLVLVVSGARFYGSAVEHRENHAAQRSALSYIQSQTAGCRGSAYVADGPEGTMLCLPEPDGKFETRIYLYENALRSELTRLDAATDPEESEVICLLRSFELTQDGDLLTITADGRTAFASLGGGAHG